MISPKKTTLKQEDLIVVPDSIDPYEVDGYTAAIYPEAVLNLLELFAGQKIGVGACNLIFRCQLLYYKYLSALHHFSSGLIVLQ